MCAIGEAAHIRTDLCQDYGGRKAPDAGNSAQLLNLVGERDEVLLHPRGKRFHRFLRLSSSLQDLADQERVVGVEAPGERLTKFRQLGAQAAPSEVRQSRRVTVTGRQPLENLPARYAQNVAHNIGA